VGFIFVDKRPVMVTYWILSVLRNASLLKLMADSTIVMNMHRVIASVISILKGKDSRRFASGTATSIANCGAFLKPSIGSCKFAAPPPRPFGPTLPLRGRDSTVS